LGIRESGLEIEVGQYGTKMSKQNTKLEAEGAEFLVLGELLLQRIPTYKCYTNMPGHDLVATNPKTNRSARIQVKSRWKTNAPFFLIKKFQCDFVVAVRLNRGKKVGGGGQMRPPEFFVLPVDVVKSVRRPGPWSKVVFKDIAGLDEKYKGNWSLIANFLAR
jgi:hypothetical protein